MIVTQENVSSVVYSVASSTNTISFGLTNKATVLPGEEFSSSTLCHGTGEAEALLIPRLP